MLTKLLTLNINDKIFALDIKNVERVISSVEITSIPELPDHIKGLINYQGEIIPVINNRKLFLIEDRELELTDMFLIIYCNFKKFCIISDSTNEIIETNLSKIFNSKDLSPNIKLTKGVLQKEGKMIIVYDVDKFVTLDEYELIKKRF